jgi:hypothetical protein
MQSVLGSLEPLDWDDKTAIDCEIYSTTES